MARTRRPRPTANEPLSPAERVMDTADGDAGPGDSEARRLVRRLAAAAPFAGRLARVADAPAADLTTEPAVFSHADPASWALLAAAVVGAAAPPGRRCWIVAPDVRTQERVHAELAAWDVDDPFFFPELDLEGFIDAVPDPETVAERLSVVHALGTSDPPASRPVVLTEGSLDDRIPDPAAIGRDELVIRRGDRRDLAADIATLEEAGYERVPVVTERGQFAVRGGILDVFSWQASAPLRVEFFDDEVDSVRTFAVETQTTLRRDDAGSVLLSREDEESGLVPLRTLVRPGDRLVVLGESAVEGAHVRLTGAAPGLGGEEDFSTACHESPIAAFDAGDFVLEENKRRVFARQLDEWFDDGWEVTIFFNNEGEQARFFELAAGELGPELAGKLTVCTGSLTRGVAVPSARLAVLTDAEIFGRYRHQRARRAFTRHRTFAARQSAADARSFSEGELVVHLDYGIGRFRGIVRHETPDGGEADVLVLEFAEESRLYVPLPQAHLVSRYVGAGRKTPPLSRLGDGKWSKARKAAERSIFDYAARLLAVQADRESLTGHAHPPDTKWQLDFEHAFLYTETPDQIRAIEETKRDMESPRPMDRLICGDVGFGKTEVAIRAAFKAVMGGSQAAILVPTTVLAQQHYETLRERMSDYPVTVELLSRFRSPAQQRAVVAGLADGSVDIVVGTHRLISGDVVFKNLGLVVIDEEQRFGVRHKERFKERFRLVDVLTLSATPIPRTLYLSLLGARDMSTIETPPPNRIPVQTTICPYDERIIRTAVQRELKRGGQVFFLHNRVRTIGKVAGRLGELCPGARVDTGHGQMGEGELEEVMHRFVRGETDVLVCTTIIESGVDIPNANTIIIDRADRFGLADLYQLRGRVGRSGEKAYALLLLPRDLLTVGDARKRINAIKQYSSLGSGFRIAMRDLEIRGAGNLLGTQQSGHINAVGFELYCRLLRQSVAGMQGRSSPFAPGVALHLDFVHFGPVGADGESPAERPSVIEAFIPSTYIETSPMRIAAYRELAEAGSLKELRRLERTWRDRFGPLPPAVIHLLLTAELRVAAAHGGLSAVEIRDDKLMLTRHGAYLLVEGRHPRLREPAGEERLREAVAMVKNL